MNKTFSLYTRGPQELVRGLDGRVSCKMVLGEPVGNTSRCWSSYRHSLLDLVLAPYTFSSGVARERGSRCGGPFVLFVLFCSTIIQYNNEVVSWSTVQYPCPLSSHLVRHPNHTLNLIELLSFVTILTANRCSFSRAVIYGPPFRISVISTLPYPPTTILAF